MPRAHSRAPGGRQAQERDIPLRHVPRTAVAVLGLNALIHEYSGGRTRGKERDLNIRGAILHMAADAAISLGVVLAGAAIWLTGVE